jgi:hypothetical protein
MVGSPVTLMRINKAPPIKVLRALGLPSKQEMKSYAYPHALSIHFCFQRLHLWVTASSQDLVYRELIRKYFGTEIMQGAEVDNGCRFRGRKFGI